MRKKAGKPSSALPDARRASDAGDGGVKFPAVVTANDERVIDGPGAIQLLVDVAASIHSLRSDQQELKSAFELKIAELYDRISDQENIARVVENFGRAVVVGASSLSPRTSAERGATAEPACIDGHRKGEVNDAKESGGSHEDPMEFAPHHSDADNDERRAYCNPCDIESDVVDAEERDFQGMAEADAGELYLKGGWSIVKYQMASKEEAVKQFRALTANRFKCQRGGNARRIYYTCAVHNECACTYRISYQKGGWVIAKQGYEDHETNDLPQVEPMKRQCRLIPIDGEGDASEDGLQVTRSTLNGPYRGVPPLMKNAVWRLHAEHGYSGKLLLQHLEREMFEQDARFTRHKLPTQKQIHVR